jgi:hypothetical protein
MSKSNTWENEFLKLVFTNIAAPLIGDAAGLQPSAAAGNLYVALHSADPGEAGDQSTSEVAYTSYARVAVPRTTGGWTVVANGVDNAAEISFPACTGSSATATHFSVGTASSGAGKILYSGALTASLAISNGITPKFAIGQLDVTED